jgi:peptide deformylase
MSLLRITLYGDERLNQKCEPVEAMTDDLRQLIADMGETMYSAAGVGLAGPQVGVLKRLLVLDVDQMGPDGAEQGRRRLRAYINPEIVWASDEDESFTEGCLSVPGVEAEVYRPSRIRVRYRDLAWNEREEDAEELLARVLQHEIDHLDGVLFVDRVGFVKRQRLAGQLRRLRTQHEQIRVPAASAAE